MRLIITILAAALAAGLAFLANFAVRRAGPAGITFIGPVLEEGIKTGTALLLDVSVPWTHLVFGVIEAGGDCAWGGRQKLPAAVFGVAAHTIFGLVTYFLIGAGLPAYVAALGAATVHVGWNSAVIRISG